MLVQSDGEQAERDHSSARNVTIAVEHVASGSALEEEERDEHEHVRDHMRLMGPCIGAEYSEGGHKVHDHNEAVEDREREEREQRVGHWLATHARLTGSVDMRISPYSWLMSAATAVRTTKPRMFSSESCIVKSVSLAELSTRTTGSFHPSAFFTIPVPRAVNWYTKRPRRSTWITPQMLKNHCDGVRYDSYVRCFPWLPNTAYTLADENSAYATMLASLIGSSSRHAGTGAVEVIDKLRYGTMWQPKSPRPDHCIGLSSSVATS